MNRLRFQSGLLLCATAALTRPAAAQQRSVPELSWQAPAGCPQAQGVRDRVRAIAGAMIERETHLRAEGEVTREEGHFHLRLVVRDGELVGERNIVSDSCEDLAGAAAVALGLLLRSEAPLTERELRGGAAGSGSDHETADAAGSGQPPADARPGAVNEAAPAARPPSSPPLAAAATDDRTRRPARATQPWRLLLRAPSLVADWGPLPGASLGLAVGVGVAHEQWRALLWGQLWLNRTVHGAELSSYGADVRHQSLALALGRQWRFTHFGLAPCLTLAVERLSAQGTGLGVAPTERSATWLSAGAGVLGLLHLGDTFALVAEVGGRVESARPIIAIDGLGDVRQLAPAALTTAVGAEWSF